VRVDVGWVAPDGPTRPAGFDARNPADPAYDFSRADAAIRAASARGLRVLASLRSTALRWPSATLGASRTQPSRASCCCPGATSQSGVYFRDGRSKPALRAFRFPLVAKRTGASSVRV
jgi:hypothetical protein